MNALLSDSRIAYALLVGGIALALLAVLIDPLRGHEVYLATVQIVVLVVGIVIALLGAYLAFVRPSSAR